jgi:hypothetical protein
MAATMRLLSVRRDSGHRHKARLPLDTTEEYPTLRNMFARCNLHRAQSKRMSCGILVAALIPLDR